MANKITERDILNSIIDGTVDNDILVAYAEKRIGQLDKRNASAAKRAAAKRAAGNEITEAVFAVLSDEPMNREQIVAALAEQGIEITAPKVTAKLTALCNDGRAQRSKTRIKGEDGKTKEATVYSIA